MGGLQIQKFDYNLKVIINQLYFKKDKSSYTTNSGNLQQLSQYSESKHETDIRN